MGLKIMREKHRGGWCDWIMPTVKQNYLMECCDCGLVHEMQFKVVVEANRNRVIFRARRSRVKK